MVRWLGPLQTDADRRQAHLVVLAMALYLVHVTFFSPWQIEDAAITYAFARNMALGEGFVANPGGTWVEGFSNPTLTLLLTVTTWLGTSPFAIGKITGIGAAVLTLPLAWRWARRLAGPDETGIWPALVPLTLALSGPFVQWSASGLENGLFNLFLAAGVVWLLEEGDARRAPWSAVPLGLLAWTRPDGPMYSGLLVLALGWRAVRTGGIRWLLGFLVISGGPFVAWHLYAYQVFGWELPNTAYAKDPSTRGRPLDWDHRSWTYVRQWALSSTHGFLFPLFVYGQTGLRGRRAWVGHVAVVLGVAMTLPAVGWVRAVLPLPAEPDGVMPGRIAVYALVVVLALLAGWSRPGRRERATALVLVTATLSYCVLVGGDWMKGWRWLSFATVPLAVLAVDGARTVALAVRRASWSPLLLVPLWVAGIGQTVWVVPRRDTPPFDVQRRALYHRGIADRMHVDHVSHTEIDMGGNLYSAGFELIDIAGLVDVPIAHHGWQQRFIDDYIWRTRRPLFIHIHGSWENKSNVVKRHWFARDWVPVPPYAHSRTIWHLGTAVRRDAFVWSAWPYEDGRTARFGDVQLVGLDTPAPEVAPGGELFLELAWRGAAVPDFRVIAFLSRDGEVLTSHELPPAYDWIPPGEWTADQVVTGRYSVPVPVDVGLGPVEIGLVVLGSPVDGGDLEPSDKGSGRDASVAGPVVWAAAVPSRDAVFAVGERRWSGVEIVTAERARERADAAHADALVAAEEDRCEEAEADWRVARRHLRRDDPWQADARARFESALAGCWARRAEPGGPPSTDVMPVPREAAEWIAKARRLDHHHPDVVRVSAALHEAWWAEGERAGPPKEVDKRWRAWRDALMADPQRPHRRRQLEELRTERFRLAR
jgi:hypothetical protein